PWLWMLTHTEDCCIFQNKTVPEIIEAVFTELGFTDYANELTGQYDPREYCVQYNETAFAFVSRLMEDEGIFYFFRHEDGKHTLVLADDASAFAALPNAPEATRLVSPDDDPTAADRKSTRLHSSHVNHSYAADRSAAPANSVAALHDALPVSVQRDRLRVPLAPEGGRRHLPLFQARRRQTHARACRRRERLRRAAQRARGHAPRLARRRPHRR